MAGFTGIIDGALQNLEDLYIDKRPYRRVQQFCHTRSRQGSWGNVCVTRCVCEYSREHSRVYVQQETYTSTAADIIQYWEGTPHRVLITVLFCLQEYFEPKYSSAGSIRAFFPERYFGERYFWKILLVNLFFPKIFFDPLTKIFLEKYSS